MPETSFLVLYLVLLFLQTVHIFEEIGLRAYELVGSLRKYLVVASVLVFLNYLPLALILLEVRAGIYLAFFPAVVALANGLVHLAGFIKTRSVRGTIGAGVFSGIPLGVAGGLMLAQLIAHL